MSISYDDMCSWGKLTDLVVNRVSVINQILGARYDGCLENPVRLRRVRGGYVCEVCGEPFVRYDLYDVPSTESALAALDSLKEGLWLLNRSGGLSFTISRLTADANNLVGCCAK